MYVNRPQHIYELRCVGFDEHLDYVINKYPHFSGKTFFIGGNHMDTYFKNGGSDMGKAISREREDLIYLNPDTADLKIGKLVIVCLTLKLICILIFKVYRINHSQIFLLSQTLFCPIQLLR